MLVPPANFGMVEEDLYRSGAPDSINFSFLETLSLKSLLWLAPEEPDRAIQKFCATNRIALYHLGAIPRLAAATGAGGNSHNGSGHRSLGALILNRGSVVPEEEGEDDEEREVGDGQGGGGSSSAPGGEAVRGPAVSSSSSLTNGYHGTGAAEASSAGHNDDEGNGGALPAANMQDSSNASAPSPSTALHASRTSTTSAPRRHASILSSSSSSSSSLRMNNSSGGGGGVSGLGMGMGMSSSSTLMGGGGAWEPITEDLVLSALQLLVNPEMYPAIVMCNQGRHRTGTVIGCLRKLQRWCLSSILEEYRRYAGPKVRVMNEQFIELFDIDLVFE